MKLTHGLNPELVHPKLWERLGLADREHVILTGEELVLTSMRRPPRKKASKHSPGWGVKCTAADVRRWRLDALGITEEFCKWMQTTLGIGVLLEPEWMTAQQIKERGGIEKIDPHIHVQLRSKPEELGFEWTD